MKEIGKPIKIANSIPDIIIMPIISGVIRATFPGPAIPDPSLTISASGFSNICKPSIVIRELAEECRLHYYQLHVTFETVDSMGANFINSCLETIAESFQKEGIFVVMSILSNYVPQCLVRAEVSCKVEEFFPENAQTYARKFVQAVEIAKVEPYRAVTHNKGIMNGIDAVVLATGNDFRAVAAGAHAYASKDGQYTSLTQAEIVDGKFKFSIEIPLSLGTVGGLTKLHPLAKLSMEILQNPTASELMQIVAVAGLAQNFAALRALTTTGIQQGHMKMHLMNILNQLGANDQEKTVIANYFEGKTVTHSAVVDKFEEIRNTK